MAKIEEEARQKAEKDLAEAKEKAEKKAAEAQAMIEKETAEATIKAVKAIENALEQNSADELGFVVNEVKASVKEQAEKTDGAVQEKVTEVEVTAPFPVEEK